MLYAVVMAGGVGTRFWPMSRRRQPKQFLPLLGKKSLFQEAVDRIRAEVPSERIIVATNCDYVKEVRRQVPAIPPGNIIGEPVGRNTAPCIGAAAALIARHDPKACMVVVTADHYIHPAARFRRCLRVAAHQAQLSNEVITFGIPPTSPATGFGYIHVGEVLQDKVVRVLRGKGFVEKPDLQTARQFIERGEHLWNSGMFVLTVDTLFRLYRQFLPKVWAGVQRLQKALGTRNEKSVFERAFRRFPSISIDYGVMNKLDAFRVIKADFDWDDVGSWTALERLEGADANKNLVRGAAELLASANCTVISDCDHIVALVGMEDTIVVHTADATLVCKKSHEQQVKVLVDVLGRTARKRFL